MKKFVTKLSSIAIVTAALAFSQNSFAKTEGMYIGFDLSRNNSDHKYRLDSASDSSLSSVDSVDAISSFDANGYGYGVNLKHAYNFNGLYIAPVIFYETINTVATDEGNDQVSVNSRHGVKLELGYDITKSISAFVNYGVGVVSYEVNFTHSGLGKQYAKDSSEIFGLGLNYNLDKNWVLSYEYNMQKVDLGTRVGSYDTRANPAVLMGIDHFGIKTEIKSMKLGVSYKF